MASADEPKSDVPGQHHIFAFPAWTRLASMLLRLLALTNVLYVAAHIVLDMMTGSRSAPPLAVGLGLALFSGLPILFASLLGRHYRGVASIAPPSLVLKLPGDQFEVPLESIKEIRPFRLPLASPGFSLVLASRRTFERTLTLPDPRVLLAALSAHVEAAQIALDHPSIRFAQEKHALGRRGKLYRVVKFGVVPLVFAVILFRLHQYIVYGGPFGQYHMYGLRPYLIAFFIRWAGVAGALVVVAVLVRVLVEPLTLMSTYLASRYARMFRQTAEIVADVVYFVLIPLYVISALLA